MAKESYPHLSEIKDRATQSLSRILLDRTRTTTEDVKAAVERADTLEATTQEHAARLDEINKKMEKAAINADKHIVGVTAGPFTAITNILVVDGIVVLLEGT